MPLFLRLAYYGQAVGSRLLAGRRRPGPDGPPAGRGERSRAHVADQTATSALSLRRDRRQSVQLDRLEL
ncbi:MULTISPECIES: hypothetical protein [Hyphomicrobium]|uniref:hypothetical protein n=1 Tax=Hyphomicrobium TaxID=81 RepID=UPI0012ECB8B1|nr:MULTISPECIES: hypothetical protein [Hyphomicrobium]WBT36877.1 hypothetical protein PE058_14585 [Hyphomicrobium sp. DMF-1]